MAAGGSTRGLHYFRRGYFTETGTMNSDPSLTMKVDEVLYEGQSKYQNIVMFTSKMFGRVLCLDNAIQCTEFDEFAYQEMISFLPLNVHPDPQNVLIIGGGDGGVAREVSKHPGVKRIIQCEIDEDVIKLSKEHLPFMAEGFHSPKLDLKVGDGIDFVKNTTLRFDIVITDSSDPIGPAEVLYKDDYYQALNNILKPGGIICCQGESMWFDLKFIGDVLRRCRAIFPSVAYSSIYIPTYPGGQIGFLLASNSANVDFVKARTVFTDEDCERLKLRYYTNQVHEASFVLPRFVQKEVEKAIGEKSGEGKV
ncbi:spermidine synthase-like isoform X1 [Varroa destructor]|uniref:PABS domain-containing protein n=2 Tax=Varroa destructor TaxID=109461 RepID=A0A7M7JNZ6_VARDE|nr:spermidine synthase-like isoform X1 [Varroa destructor]XP_022654929.1 spermidine synthase-like isoform X1 [Varroa destructor]